LTVEGACPSAQLIEPSAVALLAAVRDHFQKLIVGPQKQKPREAGPKDTFIQETQGHLGGHDPHGRLMLAMQRRANYAIFPALPQSFFLDIGVTAMALELIQ
jgi:hypothetical protein